MEQLTKKCTKCGRILPLDFFYKDKGCKYGVAGTCKKCTPDGHHWNYAYPLNVVWLCRSCHKIVHLKFGCIHENINGEIN